MKRYRYAWLVLGALALALIGLTGSSSRQREYDKWMYMPVVAMSSFGPAVPPPDEASARITVPPGFEIRIFAQGLTGRPRFMDFGPDMQLYITLMNAGQILRLPDVDGDGLADGSEIVADELDLPHGIEWYEGWLYVAEGDKVERLRDADGDGILEVRELVTDNIPGPSGHSS